MSDFGGELARLMTERGVGVRQLARACYVNPGHISNIRNGKARPSPTMAEVIDGYFGAGGELARHVPQAGSAEPEDAEAIAWARRNPRHAGDAAVQALAGVLASQRRTEDLTGSAAVLKPVLTQLTAVEAIAREARGPSRLAVVRMGAQWAQFAGWLLTTTGKQAKARARLSQSLEWAVESGDRDLLSEVLSFQGHAALTAGDLGAVIGLSQAARRDPCIYPGQLAISAAQEAKGHALDGNASEADRLLDESGGLAGRARERADEAPPWLYYHTDGFFDLQRGEVYAHLADSSHYRQRAMEAITAGYAALPADSQGAEWAAEYLVRLASLHVRDGDAEQAVALGMRAATIARTAGSLRLYGMLRKLRADLEGRWPGAPEAVAIEEALH
jgi:transcriptional regulator with XRE-family HTH domain